MNRRFFLRTRKDRLNYKVNLEWTINRALQNLEELSEEAHNRATSKDLPTEVRQNWVRIETYIYQTINSLLKTYSRSMIVEELGSRIEGLMEEAQGP